MAERRSLSNAMEFSPEKLAFIQNTPVEKHRALPVRATPSPAAVSQAEGEADDSSEEAVSIMERAAEERRASASPRKPRRAASPQISRTNAGRSDSPAPNLDHFRVGVTVRIHPHIADALRRAHLEQKLRRQSPDTQQEIVETALRNWLVATGFLSDSSESA